MSLVVVGSIMLDFLARDALVNNVLVGPGVPATALMQEANWYWALHVGSNIWQTVGRTSIIYVPTWIRRCTRRPSSIAADDRPAADFAHRHDDERGLRENYPDIQPVHV